MDPKPMPVPMLVKVMGGDPPGFSMSRKIAKCLLCSNYSIFTRMNTMHW